MRLVYIAAVMVIMQLPVQAKFTVAMWGDCRSNDGNAFTEICGYLIAEKGKTVDVHFQNGDFTQGGSADNWSNAWNIKNVREACVKDFFFMCTSNHDKGSSYLPNTKDILPSNGSNTYYYYKSWDIPGSTRKVHLLATDLHMGSSWSAQQTYFSEKLSSVAPEDWVCALYHDPAYIGMTYQGGSSMARDSFIPFLLSKNADFVLNGHAHQYRRTHILDAAGKVAERTGTSGTRHTTSATNKGIVHIVNGRGGVFASDAAGSTWAGNAFAPTYSKQEGLVTLMEFAGDSVRIKTITIGDDSKQSGVVDSWTWIRGESTAARYTLTTSGPKGPLVNLVPNPGFETAGTGDADAADWTEGMSHVRSLDKPKSGVASLKSGFTGPGGTHSQMTIPVKPGETYEFSASVFNGSTGLAYVDMNDIAGEISLEAPASGNNWVTPTATWTNSDNVSTVTLRLVTDKTTAITGSVWFDDIKFMEPSEIVQNGTITLNPAGDTYMPGTVVTVEATPNAGYVFVGWSGDLSGTINPATITMNANKSVIATYAATSAVRQEPIAFVNKTPGFIRIGKGSCQIIALPGASFTLFDLSGKIIEQTTMVSYRKNIDISGLTGGVYIARLFSNGNTVLQSIILHI